MLRPCFLVVDQEHSGSISTRKLIIETAKFNVITAYSAGEALETLEQFPAVHGVVLDAGMRDMGCMELVAALRALQPQLKIVVVGRPGQAKCGGEDHFLESFDPRKLLALLQRLEPEKTAEIEKRDEELSDG